MRPPREGHHPGSRALLAVIGTIAVLWFLKWASVLTLPLTFGIFLVGVFWPVYDRLRRAMPQGLAAGLTLLVFLAAVGLIGGGVAWGLSQAAEQGPQYVEKVQQLSRQVEQWASARGLPLSSGGGEGGGLEQLAQDLARKAASGLSAFLGGAVLTLAFFGLGLIEAKRFGHRAGHARTAPPGLQQIAHRVAPQFQKFVAVRTMIGLLTGALVTLGAWAVGLEMPVVWGVMTFLLDYIPTLGSVIAVVPPVLFALVQFDDPMMALAVFGVVGGTQLVMGNWIDPLIQGRYLQLSSVVVLASVVLWGFIWGPAGAFVSVPATIAIVLTCRQFEQTRWIYRLLTRGTEDKDHDGILDEDEPEEHPPPQGPALPSAEDPARPH